MARFDFPYMSERSSADVAAQRIPSRSCWTPGGKSCANLEVPTSCSSAVRSTAVGLAGLVADECQVQGLVCFGFPFHATGKSDQYELAPLDTIQTPTLLLQGEWDTFGDKNEVTSYSLSDKVEVNGFARGTTASSLPRNRSGPAKRTGWPVPS